MNIKEYIANKRKIQSAILGFIDEDEESETKYREVSNLLADPTLTNNKEELKQVILIISNISDNHHRTNDFSDKIGRIIKLIKESLKNNFSNQELFSFFKNNKMTLLQLVNENIITINDELFENKQSSDSDEEAVIEDICKFFSPEIEDDCTFKLGKFKSVKFSGPLEQFKEYRIKGQNSSYICELIRQDSVEEFITYVNKNNISLSSTINESIFETNSFLINKRPHLIEYAAFFGSIQIFQYIKINRPDLLNGDLWMYAIHSNNAEMIHILEENQIFPKDRTFEKCMIESIKCHHNEIFNYIKDALFDKSKLIENVYDYEDYHNELMLHKSPLLYHNFEIIPDDLESIFKLIFCLMQNEYSSLVKLVNDQTQFFFDINDYEHVKKYDFAGDEFFQACIVMDKKTKKKFMIKTFQNENYADKFSRTMICRCPSILSIKGFSPIDIYGDKTPSILTDCFQRTLLDYIEEKRKGIGDSTETKDYIIILGITIGLRHLQNNGIILEFLNPECILLDENLYPVIQNIEVTKDSFLHLNGPINHDLFSYLAPEEIEGFKSLASNVFSYSFILYYLMTLNDPLERKARRYSIFRVFKLITEGCRPDLEHLHNEIISEFLSICWHQDPKERPTFDVILDFITKEEFYSYFEPFDHDSVKKYLEEYGNEFDEIKKRFE